MRERNARDFEFVDTKLTKGAFKFQNEKRETSQWFGRIQLFANLYDGGPRGVNAQG